MKELVDALISIFNNDLMNRGKEKKNGKTEERTFIESTFLADFMENLVSVAPSKSENTTNVSAQ